MTEIQHRFSDIYDKLKNRSKQIANIYDKLNGQPHLQELIATPILEQLDREDEEEDWIQYHIRAVPWQNLMIWDLNNIIDNIGWDTDTAPGSFAYFVIQGQYM
tara:strand:- start:50 stop:358 length:309 start_codon:yes stop_codon:yes gene_type:complete